MNKAYFIELVEYNLWANEIVCNWLNEITDEQWTREVVSSFSSIRETVLHIISAEKAWLERFKKNPDIVWLQSTYKATKEEHVELWKNTSAELLHFIKTFNENELTTNLSFVRINGEKQTMPFYQLFAHVVNHATYHRGQLVTMLRQTGFRNVQSTDLLGYYRK